MTPIRLIVAVAGLAVLGSVASPAQSGSTPPDTSTLGEADLNNSPLQASAQMNSVTDRYLTSVHTELATKVDSKNALVGQEVSTRLTENAKLADGTALPKGTKLAGRVSEVQAMENGGRSLLAMTFDHAEMKGGKTLQVRCVMQMLGPPPSVAMSNSAMAPMPGEPILVGPTSTGSRSGGNNTGAAGGSGRQGGRTVGGVSPVTRGSLEPVTPAPGGAVAAAGERVSAAPRPTGLPGVALSTASTAYSSGTLLSSGRNITLESGTQITLGVIAR